MFSSLVVPFDKLYHIPCNSTTKAVKCVCLRVDLQAGILVIVERTFQEVVPVGFQIVMTSELFLLIIAPLSPGSPLLIKFYLNISVYKHNILVHSKQNPFIRLINNYKLICC